MQNFFLFSFTARGAETSDSTSVLTALPMIHGGNVSKARSSDEFTITGVY